MASSLKITPDLQAAILCEDVRTEVSGQQTLVGTIGMIPVPSVPVGFLKLCLWTRWCAGSGEFVQQSAILSCEDDQPLAQSELHFSLSSLESHATNVNVLAGLQFQSFGTYHVEIRLDGELQMRFPIPLVQVPHGAKQPE